MTWSMADDRSSEERVIQARLKLRERFLAGMQRTPGVADERPLGSGPPNRHGMPKLPVGQTPTAPGKWPVLDLGRHPSVDPAEWRLEVHGQCRRRIVLDWTALMALEQVAIEADFHCVTGWSKLDVPWVGVRLSTVLALEFEGDLRYEFVSWCHEKCLSECIETDEPDATLE